MVSNTSLFVLEDLEQENPELIAKTRGMNGPVAWDPHNPSSVVAGKSQIGTSLKTRLVMLICIFIKYALENQIPESSFHKFLIHTIKEIY